MNDVNGEMFRQDWPGLDEEESSLGTSHAAERPWKRVVITFTGSVDKAGHQGWKEDYG